MRHSLKKRHPGVAVRYLLMVLVSFLFCFIGYFNGCGCTTFVMIQGLIGAFGVRIPVSWLASQAEEVSLFHIALATPCSTVVQIVLCFWFFKWGYPRLQKKAVFSSKNTGVS